MEDFLTFKKMLTPIIIQIIFWIGVVGSAIVGLISIVGGASANYGGGGMVLVGLLWLVLGPLLTRIYCEILIVIFTINDTLTDVRILLQNRPSS